MHHIILLCSLFFFSQCSINPEKEAFIAFLTDTSWFTANADGTPTSPPIPFPFQDNGAFTGTFLDHTGATPSTTYTLLRVIDEFTAAYQFEQTISGITLNLKVVIVIGFNTTSNKHVVFKGAVIDDIAKPSGSASPSDIRYWYESYYKESNFSRYKGDAFAIIS